MLGVWAWTIIGILLNQRAPRYLPVAREPSPRCQAASAGRALGALHPCPTPSIPLAQLHAQAHTPTKEPLTTPWRQPGECASPRGVLAFSFQKGTELLATFPGDGTVPLPDPGPWDLNLSRPLVNQPVFLLFRLETLPSERGRGPIKTGGGTKFTFALGTRPVASKRRYAQSARL